MIGDLFTALRTAHSGLLAQQQALDAVAQNVANVNTPGYSRRAVSFENRVIAGEGRGVQVAALQRSVDEGLIRSVRAESSTMQAVKVRESFDARIEDLFGSPEANSALPHRLAELQAALQSLGTTPESTLDQREVVRRAEDAAANLRQVSSGVQSLRAEADRRIGAAVAEINALTTRIADYNDKIARSVDLGESANELLDARDTALDRLAELIDIKVFQRARGDVVVFTANGRTLVDDVATPLAHTSAAAVTATVTHAEGGFDEITIGNGEAAVDITQEVRGGELAGLITLRDVQLSDLQSTLDQLAGDLRDTVNSIHNQGTAYPGARELTGSRVFVDKAAESIAFAGTADTAVVLFDQQGREVRRTTMRTLLGSASGTIAQVESALNGWLGADGTALIDSQGRLAIRVTTAGRALGFRDQSAAAPDSATQPAAIAHSIDASDGGGVMRTLDTVSGFSRFFGLNDLFVDRTSPALFETNTVNGGFAATAANLKIVTGGGVQGEVDIAVGASLADIAAQVSGIAGFRAAVVSEGGGERLRITSDDGRAFVVVEDTAGGNHLLSDLGLHRSDAGSGETLAVRGDLSRSPDRLVRGAVQWLPDKGLAGAYGLSLGDGSVIAQAAQALADPIAFKAAGGIATTTITLTAYATTIISDHATAAEANRADAAFETELVASLKYKSDSIRGVNLDQEMADLMVFEQAYASAARVISTVQSMFDALERAVS